jgi:protein-disulfide isomerase
MIRTFFAAAALLLLAACGPVQPEITTTAPAAAAPSNGTPTPSPQSSAAGAAAEQEPRYAGAVPTPVSLGGDVAASLGDPAAPVTIVEFTDYQCPFCARYSLETLPRVRQELIESGLVYYQLKDLPLDIHPQAPLAAEAARCAGEQNAYWEMHDALFANQSDWAGAADVEAAFGRLAAELALDTEAFAAGLASGRHTAAVRDNMDEAAALGVSGAPSYFIDGYPVRGAQPFELFAYAVELAQAGALGDAYRRPLPELSGGAYAFGDPDAPVVLVEYTDYQCPFCARHAIQTQPKIVENYVETGQVYYIIKDFPLQQIHANALLAAQAARCAGDQGAYLEMHDMLFARQNSWSSAADPLAAFTGLAGELDLDTATFGDCLSSGVYEQAVLANLDEGGGLGVNGTPAFFVGAEFVDGAQPYEVFTELIDAQLAQGR